MNSTLARQICNAILQYSPKTMVHSGDTGVINLRGISLEDILQAAQIVRAEAVCDLSDDVIIPSDITIASVYALIHQPPTGKIIAAMPSGPYDYKGLSVGRIA